MHQEGHKIAKGDPEAHPAVVGRVPQNRQA